MGVYITLNKPAADIVKNTGINDLTALYAAAEARRLMHGYVPRNTGALCETAKISAENGRGQVFYIQPYASFCYYGEKKKFSRDKHEKATAYWDKAMILSQKGELTDSVNHFIKKKRS